MEEGEENLGGKGRWKGRAEAARTERDGSGRSGIRGTSGVRSRGEKGAETLPRGIGARFIFHPIPTPGADRDGSLTWRISYLQHLTSPHLTS
jgi:hypothetical protein